MSPIIDRALKGPAKLRDTFQVLQAASLRPIVDPLRCAILADCPVCHAELGDPLDIHRPLTIGCWTSEPSDPVRVCCYSNCDAAAIRRAIAALAPPAALIARDAIPAEQVAA